MSKKEITTTSPFSHQKPPVVGVLAAGALAPAPAGVFEKKPRPKSDVCFPEALAREEGAPAFLNPAPGVRNASRPEAPPAPPAPPPPLELEEDFGTAVAISAGS